MITWQYFIALILIICALCAPFIVMENNRERRQKYMSKVFYTDFVRHCIRFYTRNETKISFDSEAARQNWEAARIAFSELDEKEKRIVFDIYVSKEPIEDSVYNAAINYGVRQDQVWRLTRKFESGVARAREII